MPSSPDLNEILLARNLYENKMRDDKKEYLFKHIINTPSNSTQSIIQKIKIYQAK
jgi:hypothetical protein